VSSVITIVQEHDGHVEKVLGDAVLVVWGVPPPAKGAPARVGDEERATRAALAILARCKELSEARRAQRLEPFAVGIGVATGDAMIATVGTDDRAETVVVGEPVVLARRIQEEAAALSFGLLLAEETFRALPTAGSSSALGPGLGGFEGAGTPPVLVKGVGVPLTLYRVRPRR
jgi:adenylate cyclase